MKISPTEPTVPQAGIASNANAIGGTGVSGTASPGRALISGASGATWQENVQRISVGSNAILGPFINIAAGSNVTLSVASNTLTIYGLAGAATAAYVNPASPTFESDLIASLIAAGLMDLAPVGSHYWPMLSLTSA